MMDIENADMLKETILQTINFVEDIEFSHKIQSKTEIKEKEVFDQEVWKSSPFDFKLKLEQVEASEAKIKTEPEALAMMKHKLFAMNQLRSKTNSCGL